MLIQPGIDALISIVFNNRPFMLRSSSQSDGKKININQFLFDQQVGRRYPAIVLNMCTATEQSAKRKTNRRRYCNVAKTETSIKTRDKNFPPRSVRTVRTPIERFLFSRTSMWEHYVRDTYSIHLPQSDRHSNASGDACFCRH